MKRLFFVLPLFLAACRATPQSWEDAPLLTVQTIDRNGFSETISNKDRLTNFEKIDFLQSQPYQKVMRVYTRDDQGKSHAIITTYHSNGLVWQCLEVADGRAKGKYREWHPNGNLKISLNVMEGVADVSESAQMSWIFDGPSCVYDQEGNLQAEFFYEKGLLAQTATYYHPNGKIAKTIPYNGNIVDGELRAYSETGQLTERQNYRLGKQDGKSEGFWSNNQPSYFEVFQEGRVLDGQYFDPDGKLISSIKNGLGTKSLFENGYLSKTIEYSVGEPLGEINVFRKDGSLQTKYRIHNGHKHGEEWEYYPPDESGIIVPKMKIDWHWDMITKTKTWYENNVHASEREYHNNKKHGLCFAWYRNGNLMLMEEYDQDRLGKGSYFEITNSKLPVSQVIDGFGKATLYDSDGHLLHKVTYERGKPVID